MPTIAQISDLHLSPRVPARQTQVEPILQAINAAKPDLVVISGDVTDDGWERPEDLAWAKQWLEERIHSDWFAVPGNHDVGNFVSLDNDLIDCNRIDQWNAVFGNHILIELGAWAVLGLNSMLAGSDLDAENKQLDWLHDEADRLSSMADSALFAHTPLFVDNIKEGVNPSADYWLGPREGRLPIWDRRNEFAANLFGTGHVHQTSLAEDYDTAIVWAPPASGTWVHAPGLPNPPAPEKTGFVMHHLGDDGSVRSEVIACAPMLKTVAFDPLANK